MDLENSSWDLITANNDVLNHLVKAHGIKNVFRKLSELVSQRGVILTDAVTGYDILHHWEKCSHTYTDSMSYKCEVTHEVISTAPPIGLMLRQWYSLENGNWEAALLEEEELLGISKEDVIIAAESEKLDATLFDWDRRTDTTKKTSRLGIMLKKSGGN
jgi:hypothetical protein